MSNALSAAYLLKRPPTENDISGIIRVVENCKPYLTTHDCYYYWLTIHYFGATCAVAELHNQIVAWCSILSVGAGRYFLHQLGVAPCARGLRIADTLIQYLIDKLPRGFVLEFSVNRENGGVLRLASRIARRSGLKVQKRADLPNLVGSEELYVLGGDDE